MSELGDNGSPSLVKSKSKGDVSPVDDYDSESGASLSETESFDLDKSKAKRQSKRDSEMFDSPAEDPKRSSWGNGAGEPDSDPVDPDREGQVGGDYQYRRKRRDREKSRRQRYGEIVESGKQGDSSINVRKFR